jgi:solute:Na+ symporter, SSS family
MTNWETIAVFITIFMAITILGIRTVHWRSGNIARLTEWGLAGRRFGTTTAWFLLGGGGLYTANAFISIPGLVFARGVQGFYTVAYTALLYPILFIVLSRFWIVARHRGYVTAADFVRERFGRTISLLVALTGILATMPYLAIQIYGIEIALAQMGLPIDIALGIAFLLLLLSTYISGLRAPALMAIIKDIMIIIVLLVAWIVIPPRLGGLGHIFAAVHQKAIQNPATFSEKLSPVQYGSYTTLILGSALAFFLYPHMVTAIGSVNSHKVIKRNALLLPFYTLLIGLTALLGYMAIAARIPASPIYETNIALPALFAHFFPAWFAGFAFAAIVICALVPAAIMSIGVANLFTRNIYREYIRPACNEREEVNVARVASFFVKCGALVFILFMPTTFANNLQLIGSVWILQTLPAVFIGLYTRWFQRRALVIGWIAGMLIGTWMVIAQRFDSFYPFGIGTLTLPVYIGFAALLVNLLLTIVLTAVMRLFREDQTRDMINPADFEARPSAQGVLSIPEIATSRTSLERV